MCKWAWEEMKSNGVSRNEVGPKKRKNSEWLMRTKVVQDINTNQVVLAKLKMRQGSTEDSSPGSMEEILRKMEET